MADTPAAPRGPRIAIYARQSKGVTYQGNSLAVQIRGVQPVLDWMQLEPVPEFHDATNKNVKTPGLFTDMDTSAWRTPFHERTGAKALLSAIQPGDVVVVYRLDRLCRSMPDFCHIANHFTSMNVRLIVFDKNIDLGTADGKLLAYQMAALAEWESHKKSERILEAFRQKRLREGKPQPTHKRPKRVDIGSDWRPSDCVDVQPSLTGRMHIYTRVSHRDSIESGLGMDAQLEGCRDYVERMMRENPGLYRGYEYRELKAVSAHSVSFAERTQGILLNQELKRGDIVVLWTLDRGFRSIQDMANTIHDWLERGVDIHFASSGWRMSSPTGRMMAMMIGIFAEFESQLTSQRTKEAKLLLAASGKYMGGELPIFWKIEKFSRTQRLSLDRSRIAQFRLLRLYRNGSATRRPMFLCDALDRLESILAKRDNRPEIPASGVHPSNSLAWKMPRTLPRRPDGRIFRPWLKANYYKAIAEYQKAQEQWNAVAAKRRAART